MRKTSLLVPILLVYFVSCASSQKQIQQAREKDPKYQYNVGLFYLNGNNVDEAIKYLNRAISLDGGFYLAYNALGLAYSMKGNPQEAMKLYQKCLEIAPYFTEARNNLGTVYQELGFIDKAEVEFGKVITDTNYSSKELPYYNLARLRYVREDYEKALAYVNNAIKLNGRMAMAYNLRGVILQKQDRQVDAIDSFEQAVRLVPDDVSFNFNLGEAYFLNNMWPKAAEVLEKIAPQVTDMDMRDRLNLYLRKIKEKGQPAA
jgi:tetratricopeptide (TPR) repeat protein